MASSFEDPGVQIRRLQTENRRLQTENCRLKTENDRLQSENSRLRTENSGLQTENCQLKTENRRLQTENCQLKTENRRLQTENCQLKTENRRLQTVNCRLKTENDRLQSESSRLRVPKKAEKEAKKEVETLWRKEGAAVPKKDEDDDADCGLRAENRRLGVQNVLLNTQKEAEKAAEALLSQLQIENAFLNRAKVGNEADKADAIKDREEMCKDLELAKVQCESLRQEVDRKNSELDEMFAQLVEARIARDEESKKVEDLMAYIEKKLERHERAVPTGGADAREDEGVGRRGSLQG